MRYQHIALGLLLSCGCGCPTVDRAALRAQIRQEVLAEQRAEAEREAALRAALPDDVATRYRIDAADAPRRGAAQPLVTIVTFSDFQCPYCSRVQPTLERILREYPDEVALVFRHNPLPFHDHAQPAAEAAHEVYERGGDELFWRYHDLLFDNQAQLRESDLVRYAVQVGAPSFEVQAALDSGRHRERVERDAELARERGARGTPAFFLNGRVLMGAQPYERFAEIVDQEIEHARALLEAGLPREELYAHLTRDGRTEPDPAEQPARPQPSARRQPDPDAVYRVPLDGRPQLGPDDALVTIVEFTNFQCPFCGRARPTLEQVRQRYGEDVRLVVRNNPLDFHHNAMPAAEAALEVHAQLGDQGYFAYHDLLFENQRDLEEATLLRLATQVGADAGAVAAALRDHRHRPTIEEDQRLARSLGARGTPAFFINGRNLRGAQPFDVFRALIDEELRRARAEVASGTPRQDVYEALTRDGHTSQQLLRDGGQAEAEAPSAAPGAETVYQIAVPASAPARGGPPSAPVVIQSFSDFQCPFCARVRGTIDQVVQRYGNRVRIVWRDYPLPFHQHAMSAAEAAREVFQQGGDRAFWAFHDLLFDHQRSLSDDEIVRLAGQVSGVNAGRVRRAMNDDRHVDAIRRDMQAVQDAGARIGTPSFFINGRLLQGAQPLPAFEAAIDRALDEASRAPGARSPAPPAARALASRR